MSDSSKPVLLDVNAVCHVTSLSERTIDKLVAKGQFPAPKQVPGVRAKRWTRTSVEAWANRLKDARVA